MKVSGFYKVTDGVIIDVVRITRRWGFKQVVLDIKIADSPSTRYTLTERDNVSLTLTFDHSGVE